MLNKTFVIIDGNAIVHRAYHALPALTTKDGIIVNAVYGFTSMLLKVLGDLKPTYLAVSFDVSGKTFRDKLFEDYKATRVKVEQDLYDQIPLVYEIVDTFNIPIYIKKGYEADDVIGTIVQKNKKTKKQVTNIIVSGDKDMLQLVEDKKTEVYLLKKGISEYELYDEKAVNDKFGFGPEYIVDYKALMGDSSDNIPGVAGIGQKTAAELITKIGGIDEIYNQIRNQSHNQPDTVLTGKSEIRNQFKSGVIKKLEEGEESAKMSKKLATIYRDVKGLKFKFDDCLVENFDLDEIQKLFQKFEFTSLLKRVPGYNQNYKSEKERKQEMDKVTVEKISLDNMDSFLRVFRISSDFFCKEVLDGNDVLNSKLRGFVFVIGNRSWFVEYDQLSLVSPYKGDDRLVSLNEIFNRENKTLIGHDIKQLIKVLKLNDIEVQNKLFDVMIGSYLINSNTRAHDLGSIVSRELRKNILDKSNQESLFGVDPSFVAQEGRYVLQIQKRQEEQLKNDSNLGLFQKMEMPLVSVLANMELQGIAVDVELLNGLSDEATKTIKQLNKKIWKEAGEEFNVASSVQLREVLFEKMGLSMQGIKKGKTGYSTASSELEKLRNLHDIIPMIEEFREVAKLQNTYTDVLPRLVNKNTGRIHTTFNQAVTTTGRLSSSDPNLQNIPIRTELGKKIRDAFVAEHGHSLVVADYSQIELRIVASLAQDKRMLEIFKKGEDIHLATAAVINDVPLDKVTKQMRYAAKEINFGVLYGMGAHGLSWRAGISHWQAKEFIKKYFEQFAGVKKYIDQTLKFAKKEGYVETLFGRRRYIPELKAENFQLRSAGERMAINMPVQGTAADVMKMAMINVWKGIKNQFSSQMDLVLAGKSRIRNNVSMILQVHDELVLEVKNGLEDEISKMVKKEMENAVELRVPVEVHLSVGKRWGELK